MQLVAYGAQDVYLSANPQITFFKVVYRRHTNFAMESIEQVFNGSADFGRKVTATISRNGDLIHKAYLRVQLPNVQVAAGDGFRWLDWVGHVLLKSVEIEIGGQRIDKHYGDWLHIWNELTQTAGHQLGYANMVGNVPNLTQPTIVPAGTLTGQLPTVAGQVLWIPLEFWWNRNPGLALPLIALQYHEVKINIEFTQASYCYWAASSVSTTSAGGVTTTAMTGAPSGNYGNQISMASCSLFVDYIFLDTDERRRFSAAAHEYLIEQLQFTGDESTNSANNKIKLSFNHPTKELIWVCQVDENVNTSAPPTYGPQWFNYTDGPDSSLSPSFPYNVNSPIFDPQGTATLATVGNNSMGGMPGVAAGGANGVYLPVSFSGGTNPCSQVLLQLNGHDRFSQRDGNYFSLVQPYQHHENVPKQGINVYSFALKPEEHQPSGTCNFSRIDTAVLQLTLTAASVVNSTTNSSRIVKIRVYAVNYNVLRIMSGMGGLAYSN